MQIALSTLALHLYSNTKHSTAATRPPMVPQLCWWRRAPPHPQRQQLRARVHRIRVSHSAVAPRVLLLPLPRVLAAALRHMLRLTCLVSWRLALFSFFEYAREGIIGAHRIEMRWCRRHIRDGSSAMQYRSNRSVCKKGKLVSLGISSDLFTSDAETHHTAQSKVTFQYYTTADLENPVVSPSHSKHH